MQTFRDIAPYVALGSAVLSLVLLILVVVLMTRVGRLRRAQTVVLGHHEQRDIVAHTEDLDTQVRNLREAVEILTDQLDDQKRHLDHALTNRAIIRYDAFRDAGGEQSASFALLDEYRSGVVFSAIAARDFARIYVKYLTEGVADRDLSPEEVQAMEAAVPKPLHARRRGPASQARAAAREPASRGTARPGAGRRRARGARGAGRVAGGDRGVRGARRCAVPGPGRARWRRGRGASGPGTRGRLHLGTAVRAAGGRRHVRPLTRLSQDLARTFRRALLSLHPHPTLPPRTPRVV